MRPAWSVVLLTTLSGTGQGLFIALFVLVLFGVEAPRLLSAGALGAATLAALGLLASFFHLGRWRPAWRAASQWRTSWLSREVIVLPAFIVGALACVAFPGEPWLWVLTLVVCLALFVCTAMIYACLSFLQEWATPLTVLNFFLLGTASGFTLAAVFARALAPGLAGVYAACAMVLTVLALLARSATLLRNARLQPRSTTQSAIGVRHPKVVQRSQGFTGGSFNTREFFHGRPAPVLRAVRWGFLLFAFAVPVLLLLAGLYAPAFAVQLAGLVAERWYFFAEARHPQNLYYQSVS
ncbi:MAG: dimethyl sulfoxide reductase anchor subunit family protein [Betaproteobacteria bacterium]